jgi:hypothetical protein
VPFTAVVYADLHYLETGGPPAPETRAEIEGLGGDPPDPPTPKAARPRRSPQPRSRGGVAAAGD